MGRTGLDLLVPTATWHHAQRTPWRPLSEEETCMDTVGTALRGGMGTAFFFFSFLSSPEDIFPYFVQIEWEREREKHRRERDTLSGCHPHNPTRARDKLQLRYVPLAGTEPGLSGPKANALTAEPNRPGRGQLLICHQLF
uniref:Uncharacterized protein n=1 Tax=Molossus molossus TaxID=27622 RepID=A0A7J8I9R0_MOLMO|nr:hypothetical protein HJG59_010572 [Molossus molossus]